MREWHACACATCGERICLRVKPMRRKGGHIPCAVATLNHNMLGALRAHARWICVSSKEVCKCELEWQWQCMPVAPHASGSAKSRSHRSRLRAPGYQQLSRRLHWAAISIHGNCRACASGTHARHMQRICLRVKPMRRKGGHIPCAVATLSYNMLGALGAHARWMCVSSEQ